ncbi:MAG TPA: hypothetical protein VL728_18880 [Cyclobacteriaceae bacterium]|jgi:hypothetical protein|nr:hypothetical protein [Cyclobacteriaceae bacterium]
MKCAYNEDSLYRLEAIKEAKRWEKGTFISKDQLTAIVEEYKVNLYHPNLMIRLLLFVATALGLSGVTGLFGTILFSGASRNLICTVCILYGAGTLLVLEKVMLKNNHFKSGVTEAIMYYACGFLICGIGGLTDFDLIALTTWTCVIVFSLAAIRYLDLLMTAAALLSLAYGLFYHLYEMGGIGQRLIPFVFIIVFAAGFLMFRKLEQKKSLLIWTNNLMVAESLSLLLAYAGGNYFVVRELSVNLMSLQIEEGGDVPFAYIFYALTLLIPCLYLYFGIKKKDILLIRVSLFVFAFSAFTFKYYFSMGTPEITLTLAGAIVFGIALAVMNYLKIMRKGFTRENLLSEKWAATNIQSFVISQTLGGNQAPATQDTPGGGRFGGGGSAEDF